MTERLTMEHTQEHQQDDTIDIEMARAAQLERRGSHYMQSSLVNS
jgi:hypothetical protein